MAVTGPELDGGPCPTTRHSGTSPSSQHGVVSRRQLVEIGFTPQSLAHAVDAGRLDRLSERVLRSAAAHPTLTNGRWLPRSTSRGAIALRSAAALWRIARLHAPSRGMCSPLAGRIEAARRLGIAHSTVRWGPEDVTSTHGIPVTTPLRTLVDLARGSTRTASRRRATECSTPGCSDSNTSTRSARPARPEPAPGGDRELRRLIELRPPGYRPAESNLERRFETILADAGDAPFERQVDLGDDDGWIGRVDFVDRNAKDRRRDPERPLPLGPPRPGAGRTADRQAPRGGLARHRDLRARDLAPQGPRAGEGSDARVAPATVAHLVRHDLIT